MSCLIQQEITNLLPNFQTTLTYSEPIKTLTQQIYNSFPFITVISQNKHLFRFAFSIYQQQIQSDIQILVQIDFSLHMFQMTCFYYRNLIPIAINATTATGIFKRFITRQINKQQPYIAIDQNNGILKHRMKIICTKNILHNCKNFFKFLSSIIESLKTSENLFRKKLFQPCNMIPKIYQESPVRMLNIKKHMISTYANFSDAKFQIIGKYVSLSVTPINSSRVGQNKQFIFQTNNLKAQNPQQIQTRHLYCFDIRKQLYKVQPINYAVDQQDQIRLAKALQDYILLSLKNDENKFIFNYVKVLEPQKVNPKPYKVGGFSIMMLTMLNFKYMKTCYALKKAQLNKYSEKIINQGQTVDSEEEQQQRQQIKPLTKWICIKVPRNQQHIEQFQREIAIVRLFRTTNSPYLLKYYTSDQFDFRYRQRLMVDACNIPSLSQYLDKVKVILSLQSKIQLLLHIIKSIIFLQRKKVVHMDLKPANILISPQNQLIKLIDFGQAYNQTICGSSYFPGYSLPYSSPQALTPLNKKYTSKSDVFSFGIMMYEILFQKRPFSSISNLKEVYKNKQHLNKLEIIHESFEDQFSDRVFDTLILVMTKCLDKEQSRRPQPSWIALILFMCLAQMRQNW